LRIAAAVLRGAGAAIQVREVELAAPGTGKVLVHLKASRVCHSAAPRSCSRVADALSTASGH